MSAIIEASQDRARTIAAVAPQIKLMQPQDAVRWDEFVQRCPQASFFHRAGWQRVIEQAFGHKTYFYYAEVDGRIEGVLPLAEDSSPAAKDFVERFRKTHPGRTPSSEVSYNYTIVHATAIAMKLAGTTTDATAIRAQMDKAVKSLTTASNPGSLEGIDDKGGTINDTRVGVVENGKIKEVKLSTLNAVK